MKYKKIGFYLIAILLLAAEVLGIYFVLQSEDALLTHPKGVIAQRELEVIVRHIILMLIIVAPTVIAVLIVAWKYHDQRNEDYDPEHSHGPFGELILWIIPSIIIAIMMFETWYVSHELDPHQPLKSDVKPLMIQVIALDWKWLFIYPEQGVATLNFIQFPDKTPINLSLTGDNSPINSFWIPQLSGQIYAMSGMITPLHIMADEPGIYSGRAAEINGEGLAHMTFVAKSSSQADFEKWIEEVKKSPLKLSDSTYKEIAERSINNKVALYSTVEKDLFNKIVMKYMTK